MDLSCDDEIKANNAIFIVLTLGGLFAFIGSFLSDNFGRRGALIVTTLVASVGSAVSLVKQAYWPIVFGLTIQTICKLICLLERVGDFPSQFYRLAFAECTFSDIALILDFFRAFSGARPVGQPSEDWISEPFVFF